MSMIDTLIQYRWSFLFYFGVILLVYLNRKKFEKIMPLSYLFRTKLGLDMMDKYSTKFRGAIKVLGYIGIVSGYIGMAYITYMLVGEAGKIILAKPEAMGGAPVIPGFPIHGLGIVFPLIIGWISLFIIMVVHEFSHGIVARAHGIKVKSSGIAFFGPLLGAFVEPDDKQLMKKKQSSQLSVFAAGPFSNMLLTIACLGLMLLAGIGINSINPGVGVDIAVMQNDTLPASISGMPENSTITMIGSTRITDTDDLEASLAGLTPGQEIKITTKEGVSYDVVTVANPEDPERAYIGIWILGIDRELKQDNLLNRILLSVLEWFYTLFFWTELLSLMIGLFNLFPFFITDGAQMLRTNLEHFIKDKKLAVNIWKYINMLGMGIFFILLWPFFRNILQALFTPLISIFI